MENYLHDFLAHWGYLGIFLIIFFDNMNIPFPPTEVVLSMTGWFIAKGIFSFWAVFIISTVAGILGCIAFYLILYYAEDWVMPKLQKWLRISDHKLSKATNFFDKFGGVAILLGRLIPGMRTISLIPAGIFKYPLVKYTLWVTLGTIIWNGALLILGHLAGSF